MDCYLKIWILFNHFQSCKREHHHKKKIRLSLLGHRRFLFNLDDIRYTHMGCWKISSTSPIASLEQKDYRLIVPSGSRQNAIQKCYEVAKDRGFNSFAIYWGGMCTANADVDVNKGERYHNCEKGRGSARAADVYIINGK